MVERVRLKRKRAGIGRPSSYRPEYCERFVEAGLDGYSLAAFAGSLGVAIETVRLWTQAHPEFMAAKKVAEACAVRFWEERLRDCSLTGVGNVTAAIFGLKNRAREYWSDRTQVEAAQTVRLELDEAMISALAAKSPDKLEVLRDVLKVIASAGGQVGPVPAAAMVDVTPKTDPGRYGRMLTASSETEGRA